MMCGFIFTVASTAHGATQTLAEKKSAPALSDTSQVLQITVCGIDIANPPFHLLPSSNTQADEIHNGVAYSIMQEVSQQLGVKVKIVRYPWKRCLKKLQKGTVDGVMGASFVKERTSFGHYPTTSSGEIDFRRIIYSSEYWLYTNNSSVKWDGKSLTLPHEGITATGLGYSSGKLLQKLGVKVHEEYLPSSLAYMLFTKRPVVIAGYAGQIDPYINQESNNKSNQANLIVKLPIPLSQDDMFLLISKPFYQSHKELTEKIWDLFGEIHHNGRYDEILNSYFVE